MSLKWILPAVLLTMLTSPARALGVTGEIYPFTETGVVETGPWTIMGRGLTDLDGLVSFFLENNPDADVQRVERIAAIYMEESQLEGVSWDIAFVQMCLETGFLCFGGLVTEDMNNFCGLGAVSPQQPGIYFDDERTGIRAHIQHLKAYASTEPLVEELVDPRFHLVQPRGRAPDIYGLAGTWAADPEYGRKLESMLEVLYR